MADSHDNIHNVRRAVQLFNDAQCRLVIHAGDFVAPFAARELASLTCPVKAVFGNCDGEKKGLEKAFKPFGVIREAPHTFTHEGLRIILVHLDFTVDSYVKSGEYDVAVFGHTHKPSINTQKHTLLVNPGETGGWVSGKSTVSLLNPQTLEAEIIGVD